jgi:hypothetical protein
MASRNSKSRFRHPIAPLILASSLVGGVAACSLTSDPPAVTQLPPTISAQAPETAVQGSESIAFYYDGVKTSVTIKDAAVLFAACTLNTNDSRKIVNFVNNTLKVGPITDADVTGLGEPLKPSVSDFTDDGVVDCKDAAVLFAAISTGLPPTASKINSFLATTLKLSGITVTQPHLDTFFREPTPTPTPPPPPTPNATPTPPPPPTPSVAQFFVDPVSGSDTNPGTATQPFQTVKYALTTDIVRAAANTIGSGTNGGTDVTVTVMVTGTATESVANNISTPTLARGSVTVVGPSGFNLQLNGKLLTLNKGYRLKGFQITSGDPGEPTNPKAAINLAGVGTSLENMKIDCKGLGNDGTSFTSLGDRCIEVTALTLGGTILLQGLEVEIKGDKKYTAAIVHAGNNTTLEVVGSTIRSTDSGGKGVVGVLGGASAGPVTVQSSTVNLESIRSGTNDEPNIAVLLNVGSSKVLGPNSEIKLNGDATNHPKGAIGIKASHSSGSVSVDGTTFSTGTNGVGIGINKAGGGSLNLVNNTFPSSGNLLWCKFYDSSSSPPSCVF